MTPERLVDIYRDSPTRGLRTIMHHLPSMTAEELSMLRCLLAMAGTNCQFGRGYNMALRDVLAMWELEHCPPRRPG